MENENINLHISAKNGDTETVIALLEKGADVNSVDDRNATSLHLAALKGHKDICNLLISNNANVNAIDDRHCVSLHYAAQKGDIDIGILLIKNGADVNAKDITNVIPLHFAALKGHKDFIKLLIENGANINFIDNVGNSILHYAIEHADILHFLLLNKINVNVVDKVGLAPLHYASIEGYTESAKILLESKANPNEKNYKDGMTPLHYAVHYNNINIIKLLITCNANINVTNDQLYTPLYLAVYKGHKSAADLLIKHGADINYKNVWEGMTILEKTIAMGNKKIIKLLLSYGVSINVNSNNIEIQAANNTDLLFYKNIMLANHIRKICENGSLQLKEIFNLRRLKLHFKKNGIPSNLENFINYDIPGDNVKVELINFINSQKSFEKEIAEIAEKTISVIINRAFGGEIIPYNSYVNNIGFTSEIFNKTQKYYEQRPYLIPENFFHELISDDKEKVSKVIAFLYQDTARSDELFDDLDNLILDEKEKTNLNYAKELFYNIEFSKNYLLSERREQENDLIELKIKLNKFENLFKMSEEEREEVKLKEELEEAAKSNNNNLDKWVVRTHDNKNNNINNNWTDNLKRKAGNDLENNNNKYR